MKFQSVKARYQSFFFTPISAQSLGLFRIFFSIALLANALLLCPDLKTWFSENGVLPQQVARDTLPGVRVNVFQVLPNSDSVLYGVFYFYLVSILLLLFGVFSRTATFFVFVLTVSFSHRNVFILNSGDTLARCLLFFMLIAPMGKTFSVDRLIRIFRGKTAEDSFIPWAQRMMQYQISIMYLATVLWKLRGNMWVEGTAVCMTSHLEEFRRFPMPDFTRTMWYSWIATYYALFVEFAMGALVWFEEFRYPVLFMGICLHLGLEYAMNVPVFQWVALSSYVLFVDRDKLIQIRDFFVKRLSPPRQVYFDGDCGFCSASVLVLTHLDLFKRFNFVSSRSEEAKMTGLPMERIEHEVLLKENGKWLGGFDAFRVIFRRLPLTFLFTPFLYIPPVPLLGRKVYRWIAKNRYLVSKLLGREGAACKIK